jgi:hypothetical protein
MRLGFPVNRKCTSIWLCCHLWFRARYFQQEKLPPTVSRYGVEQHVHPDRRWKKSVKWFIIGTGELNQTASQVPIGLPYFSHSRRRFSGGSFHDRHKVTSVQISHSCPSSQMPRFRGWWSGRKDHHWISGGVADRFAGLNVPTGGTAMKVTYTSPNIIGSDGLEWSQFCELYIMHRKPWYLSRVKELIQINAETFLFPCSIHE